MTFVALIANGEIQDYPYIKERLKHASQIIAVDGGLVHCSKMGITPDLLIGDLDSCPTDLLKRYPKLPIKKFPSDKDETDLEIALKMFVDDLPVRLFGAVNKRIDHTLYNLQLLARYPNQVIIESEAETLFILRDHTAQATKPGQVISLIPLNGTAQGVSTKGLKWNLDRAALDYRFMSISNVALGEKIEVSVAEGNLLVILNNPSSVS